MNNSTWVKSLFNAIDSKDTEGFVSHLKEDSQFRFGNGPLVEGKNNIAEYVSGFFAAIAGLSHVITDAWDTEDGVVCHGTVSYTRMDQSVLTVPFANVFISDSMNSSQANISNYLIFADTSELFPSA